MNSLLGYRLPHCITRIDTASQCCYKHTVRFILLPDTLTCCSSPSWHTASTEWKPSAQTELSSLRCHCDRSAWRSSTI